MERSKQMLARLRCDRAYRTRISLLAGLYINLTYVGLKLLMGMMTGSMWFVLAAVYYLMLTVMRSVLYHYITHYGYRRKRWDELRLMRLCGALMLVMNLMVIFIVAMAVHVNRSYHYPGVMIYAMAAYAFYAVIAAAIHLFREAGKDDPVLFVIRVISLSTALVSIFSLETALLTAFGQEEPLIFKQITTGATGAVICACVMTMAVLMIARSTGELRQMRTENRGKR